MLRGCVTTVFVFVLGWGCNRGVVWCFGEGREWVWVWVWVYADMLIGLMCESNREKGRCWLRVSWMGDRLFSVFFFFSLAVVKL